jgi:hypothetical protein
LNNKEQTTYKNAKKEEHRETQKIYRIFENTANQEDDRLNHKTTCSSSPDPPGGAEAEASTSR